RPQCINTEPNWHCFALREMLDTPQNLFGNLVLHRFDFIFRRRINNLRPNSVNLDRCAPELKTTYVPLEYTASINMIQFLEETNAIPKRRTKGLCVYTMSGRDCFEV